MSTTGHRRLMTWFAIALAVVAAGCANEAEETGAPVPVQVGAPAPAYRAVSLAGDTVSLAGLRDKVVLLNIWATWCAPCRTEIPALQALHEEYADDGLEIIGVSVDAAGEQRKVSEFLEEFGVTYDIWHDPEERVAATFLAVGVPATYLIGRDGALIWKHIGPIRRDDPRLMPVLKRALGASD